MIKKIISWFKNKKDIQNSKETSQENSEEYDLSDTAFTDFLNEMEKLELYKKEVKNETKR